MAAAAAKEVATAQAIAISAHGSTTHRSLLANQRSLLATHRSLLASRFSLLTHNTQLTAHRF
eukprot:2863074-Prymnesium_polylepis.4